MNYVAPTGAKRTSKYPGDDKGQFQHPLRFDLIFKNPAALRALADAYGEGMKKYGRDNWKQGFEESVLMDHALVHLMYYINGDDRPEDKREAPHVHLGHVLWNIGTILDVRENHPELLDLTGSDPGPEDKKETSMRLVPDPKLQGSPAHDHA